MLNTALSPWPAYSDEEIEAVDQVLRSGRVNYWTGTEGREFEREFALWCGSGHAVALANGTVPEQHNFQFLPFTYSRFCSPGQN